MKALGQRFRGAACLLAVTVCLAACAPEGGAPPAAPSILLITLDTTRADHLGCYGQPALLTPNLDLLAADGVVFDDAIVQSAVTPVSHASLFTGLNPYAHGLRVLHGLKENRLPEPVLTLAEALRGRGYSTAAFVSAFSASEHFGLAQGFDVFDADFLVQPVAEIVTSTGLVKGNRNQRQADATTDRALAWLARAPERFFLWLHYFDPHDPIMLPPAPYLEGVDLGGPPRETLRAIYRGEIAFMDAQIGRVLAALAASGRLEDLIVVVMADHGEGLGDHDWWTHLILYQEQIRVPLILRLPASDARERGRRIGYLVRSIDVMPTLLELAGVAPADQPPMEGASLVPLLDDAAAPDPGRAAYADSLNILTVVSFGGLPADVVDDLLFSVNDGSWSYVHHLQHPEKSELYDLGNDPRQLVNLIAERPEETRRMQRILVSHPFRPRAGDAEPGEASADSAERLRALGYVQ